MINKSNVNIDLDEKILKFINEKTKESIEDINQKINDIVCFALEEQNILDYTVYISISSSSKQNIRELNNKYRNIDKETDVLSFPIFDRTEIENLSSKENKESKENNKLLKEIELGDIIICLDVVEEHSIEYGTGILREMLYMITHGVSHLLGYDHIIDTEKKEMRAFEEKILEKVGVVKLDE